MSEPARSEPVWLTAVQTKMLHAESLALFGGSPGVRDEGLLHSALARPRNRWAYEEGTTLFEHAAHMALMRCKLSEDLHASSLSWRLSNMAAQ